MPSLTLPEFIPHEGQRRILRARRKRNVCCMGRRFGKTYLMQEVVTVMPGSAFGGADGTGKRGLPCAWYAPNDAYFMRVFLDIALQYTPVIRRATSQPRPVIEFVNGGRIDFWTLENPMKCGRGNHYARIIVDEAAHARHLKDAWEKTITWTLADLDGDAWFISTPNGINYFHELYKKGESGDPDWVSHKAPSMANPHLPAGWMDEQRDRMPELVFAQEVLAEFVSFGAGLVKPSMIRYGRPPPGLRCVLGVDLAISTRDGADFSAIVAMTRDETSGIVYVLEAERFRGAFHEVKERIEASAARHQPVMIAIEQAQYQAAMVQEIARTTTLPVRGIHPDRDKIARFAPLLTRFEQNMVMLDTERVPAWFVDELLAFPVGDHDDGVDAAAYAFSSLGRGTVDYATRIPHSDYGDMSYGSLAHLDRMA